MLPEGWVRKPLSACAKFVSGGTPSKGNNAYWGGEFPWITAKDMKTLWLKKAGLGLTDQGRSAATIVPSGSILTLTRGMTLLKDFPVCLAGCELAFNQDIKALLPHGDVDSTFLAYQLIANKQNVLNLVDTAGHGTGRLDTELLKGLLIDLPPLPEQRRIAAGLATWDKAIAIAERLLANSFKQKRALMRELLNPCNERNGWHAYRLCEMFTERVEAARDDLPLLSITRDEGVILRSDVGRKDTSNDDKSKYLRICQGDIGYNTMRMWQGVSALSSLEGIVSPAYTVLVPNEKIDARFAAYLFKLNSMVFQFYRHSQGMVSDTWSLKFKHFAQIKVTIPSRKEQKRIVEVLATSDRTIEALEGGLGRLQGEKQALMQQLLTGKRRVHLPEPANVVSP